jgi:Tfp pilus assembly protein PilF
MQQESLKPQPKPNPLRRFVQNAGGFWSSAKKTVAGSRKRRIFSLAMLIILLAAILATLYFWLLAPRPKTLYEQGRELYYDGHYIAATEVLRQELKLNPAHRDARLLLAQSQVNLRQFPGATASLNEILRAEPQNPLAFFWLGKAQAGANNPDAAATTWKVLTGRTDNAGLELKPRAQAELGALLYRQGKFEDSAKLLYEALGNANKLDALERQQTYYLYGLLLARDLRFDDATNALQQAQKVALPGNENDNVPRKAAYARRNDKLKTLLAKFPDAAGQRVDAARRARLAYAFFTAEEYGLAEEQLGLVLKAVPKYADARAYLGLIYWRTGRGERAYNTFQTALADEPKSRFVRQVFAEYLLDRLSDLPTSTDTFRSTAEYARSLIDGLATEFPQDATLQVLLARYFMTARHDYQTGVKHYKNAVVYNRQSPVAGLNPGALLARYYSETNLNPCVLGVDTGLEATRDQPDDAESWFAAGQAYQLCGHPNLAIPMLERGLALQPYRTDLLHRLALAHDMQNNKPEADRLFRLLADFDPAGVYNRVSGR